MHMHQSCLGFFLWTIPCILQQMPIEFLCLCVSFSLFPHFNLFAEEKDKRNPAVYEVIEKLKESLWKLKYQHFLSCNWEKNSSVSLVLINVSTNFGIAEVFLTTQ